MELELEIVPIILLISRWNYGIAVVTTSIQMICFFSVNICITSSATTALNYLAGIYLLNVHNRNIKTRCEICSKLTIKTPERRPWCSSGVFFVNIKHVLHLVLVILLLTLTM